MVSLSRFFRTDPAAPAEAPGGLEALETSLPKTPEQLLAALAAGTDRAGEARAAAKLVDQDPAFFARVRAAGNAPATLAVAELCENAAYLEQILDAVSQPQEFSALALQGSTTRLRQLAAQRIEDVAELNQVLKQIHGKDKNVYRIIKHKCDERRADQQRQQQTEAEIHGACVALERLGTRLYDPLYPPAFEHYAARWRTLEEQAGAELKERAKQALHQCQEIIDKHRGEIAAQDAASAVEIEQQRARAAALVHAAEESARQQETQARASAEAAQAHEVEQQARREKLEAVAQANRKMSLLIAKAHGALRAGHSSAAAGLRRAIEEKLPHLPAHLARPLADLDAKLGELKAWKDYAVAPKRAELIVRMQDLIGSSQSPQAVAERIRELRAQWKTASKGIAVEADADWEQFNQAAETAYLPCREYFQAQEALRLENTERRRTVLARLLAFEAAQNSEHTDWRLMMVVLREAPQEWRHIFPVDRSTQLALQEEFESALTRLRTRLGAWLSENAAAKKSLILRAQQLLTKDDHRDAVDGVKFLQQRWQESGPAAHPEDQVLWQEFRQHCDAVFQKRQQAQSQYADTLAANKDQAIALCTEIELAATASGSALLESMTKMPHWHAAFAAISELPRADERALQARFERAVKRCQSQLTLQRSRDQLRSLECLLQSAQLIRAYGQTVARDGTASEREAAKIAAEAFIAAVPHWPKGSAPALKDAWHQAETASAAALASNETALRTVCIRGELLKNLVSPLEDQQLRRNYQLQRLVQSMGQHVNATDVDYDAQLLALVLDWIRVGPVTEGLHESLCARFTHLVMDRHERQ